MADSRSHRLKPGELYVYHSKSAVTWLRAQGWAVSAKIERRGDDLFAVTVWDELQEATLCLTTVKCRQTSVLRVAIETLKVIALEQGVKIFNRSATWPADSQVRSTSESIKTLTEA